MIDTVPDINALLESVRGIQFQEYSKRRTRDAFVEHRSERDESKLRELLDKGWKEVKVLEVRI